MKKNVLFSVFAVLLAGVAAVAATTAYINAPARPQHPDTAAAIQATVERMTIEKRAAEAALALALQDADAAKPDAQPAAPAAKPEAAPKAGAPAAGAPGAAPAAADEEADKDPYEGLNPEELPPDLQYNADSSVSFPTNI